MNEVQAQTNHRILSRSGYRRRFESHLSAHNIDDGSKRDQRMRQENDGDERLVISPFAAISGLEKDHVVRYDPERSALGLPRHLESA